MSAATFCQDLGISLRAIIDGDAAAIHEIASLGGAAETELNGWSPNLVEDRKLSFRRHRFHSLTLRNPAVRGCPVCLREDAANSDLPPEQAMGLRGHWLLPHLAKCQRHDHPLITLYSEAHPTERYDSAKQFYSIQDAILNGELDRPRQKPNSFEYWMEERLVSGPGTDWLSGHPLHAASVFCRLLGIALLRLEDRKIDDIEEQARHLVYEKGFEVAKSGEQAIQEALARMQSLVETPQDGPKKIYPALYDRLSNDYAKDPDYAPFRKILRDHLIQTWPLGPGDELLGEPVQERRLHSVTSAAKETGVDPRRLRKLLIAAGLVPERSDLPDAWSVFDAKAAAPILNNVTTLLSASEFWELIGATRSQFELLVADGVLKPVLEASATKSVWDPKMGADFLDSLLANAVQVRHLGGGWEHISKSAQRLKIRPGQIINAITEGQLRRVGNYRKKIGYAAVYVYDYEVTRMVENESLPGMSIEAFTRSVGARSIAGLRRLILDGHTPATRAINPRTRAEQLCVTEIDQRMFHAKFFTPRTMAEAYGRSWQSLRVDLERLGVTPFTRSKRDYGRIFLRSKVESVLAYKNGD